MKIPDIKEAVLLSACVRGNYRVLVLPSSDAPPELTYLETRDRWEINGLGCFWLDGPEKRALIDEEEVDDPAIMVGERWAEKNRLQPRRLFDGRVFYARNVRLSDRRATVSSGFMRGVGALFLVENTRWQVLHKVAPCIEDVQLDPSLRSTFPILPEDAVRAFAFISPKSVLDEALAVTKATRKGPPIEPLKASRYTVLLRTGVRAEIGTQQLTNSDSNVEARPFSSDHEITSLLTDYPRDAADQLVRLPMLTVRDDPHRSFEELTTWITQRPEEAAESLRRVHSLTGDYLPALTSEEAQAFVAAFRGVGLPPVAFSGDFFATEIQNAAVYNGELASYLGRLQECGDFHDLDVCERPADRIAAKFRAMSLKQVAALAVALSRFFHAAKLPLAGDLDHGRYFNIAADDDR